VLSEIVGFSKIQVWDVLQDGVCQTVSSACTSVGVKRNKESTPTITLAPILANIFLIR